MLSLILVPLVLGTLPRATVLLAVCDIMGSDRLDGNPAGVRGERWEERLVPGWRVVPVSKERLMAWKSDL